MTPESTAPSSEAPYPAPPLSPRPSSPSRPGWASVPAVWRRVLAALVSLPVLFVLMQIGEGQRLLLALAISGILFFLIKRSPAVGLVATLAFLAMLGGIRRWLIPAFGWSGTDPMLLTGPVTLTLFLLSTRQSLGKTLWWRRTMQLLALMALQVFNPLQGGITVGLFGILFFIVPLAWYFVGRQVATPALLLSLFRGVVGVAVAAALYGLFQPYFGFPVPGEKEWMKITAESYVALNIADGVVRAFSFFTSASEYSAFLALAIVLLWAMWLRGSKSALLPMPLLVVALFLETARGPIVSVLFACVVLWAIQGRQMRSWGPRLAVAAVLGVAGLVWSLHQVQDATFSDSTQALVTHQTNGLLNPLDENKSTAPGHFTRVVNGIIDGFRQPFGLGLGATTIAGGKFAGASYGTEVDVSDVFVGLGFVGGILYVVLIGMVFRAAVLYWHTRRSMVALCLLGTLIALFGNWLHGGNYAISTLSFICIGALERLTVMERLRTAGRPA